MKSKNSYINVCSWDLGLPLRRSIADTLVMGRSDFSDELQYCVAKYGGRNVSGITGEKNKKEKKYKLWKVTQFTMMQIG